MFKIEKQISVPEIKLGRPSKFPFKEMQVGDSFHVSGRKEFRSARESANSFKFWNEGYNFTSRTDQDKQGGRIWRIA